MNERIKELLKQATKEVDPHDRVWVFSKVDQAKFAELIVRECVDICNKIYFSNYPDAEDWERSEEGDAIKEHFGVEE